MPVKLSPEKNTVEERIAALRLTIKRNEGLTLEEVSQAIGRSIAQISKISSRNGWLVKQFNPAKRNYLNLLVHPKTLQACRKK